MKNTFFFIFIMVCLFNYAHSQPITFEKTYGGALADSGITVIQTLDGGYLIAGGTFSYGTGSSDYYLIKTDEYGDTLWTKTYGGTGKESLSSMIETNDGNYALWGFTNSYGELYSNFYLIKVTPAGDTLWTKTYTGVTSTNYLKSNNLVQCPDSGFLLSGSRNYIGDYTYGYTIRTDSMGNDLWTNSYQNYFTYAGFENTLGKEIIVTGEYSSSTSRDVKLMFLSSSTGNNVSNILFDNNNNWEEGYSIMPLIQGGYLISGYTGSSHYGAYIIRVDDNFNKIWDKAFNYGELYINQNFPTGRNDFSVIQTADTGFAFLGRPQNAYDIKLIKTDSSGVEEWSQIYGGADIEEPFCLQQTSDNGFVIVGYTTSYGAGSKDIYLIKTDSAGNTTTTHSHELSAKQQSISIYPNPAKDILHIKGEQGNTVTITSIDGKLMQVFKIKNNNDEIDLRSYSKGIYILKALNSKGIKAEKIIIK